MDAAFTKFDALGVALSTLNFDHITICLNRWSSGETEYSVTLQLRNRDGSGDLIVAAGIHQIPSGALENALARFAQKQAEMVERAAA